jgi:hypothetical protein
MSCRVLLTLIIAVSLCNASEWMKNRSATGKYKKGKYVEAEKDYHAAQIEAPEKKELAFNRGCALYKMGDFENAAKEFDKAKSVPDILVKKKSAFNAANTMFKKGLSAKDESGLKSVEEAAKIYKEILKREPSDLPSRQNLEKALHVIEQMKKQQDEQDKNKDDKQDKQDKKDKNEQKDNEQKDKEQQQKKDEQDKKNEEKKQENKEDDKEDESKQQPQPKAGEMSKEEAQKLLDALKEDEQEKQKKLMQLRSRGKKLEKDW